MESFAGVLSSVDCDITTIVDNNCTIQYESERNIFSKADVLKVVELDLDLKIVYAKFQSGEELNGTDQTIIAKSLVKYLLNQNVNRE